MRKQSRISQPPSHVIPITSILEIEKRVRILDQCCTMLGAVCRFSMSEASNKIIFILQSLSMRCTFKQFTYLPLIVEVVHPSLVNPIKPEFSWIILLTTPHDQLSFPPVLFPPSRLHHQVHRIHPVPQTPPYHADLPLDCTMLYCRHGIPLDRYRIENYHQSSLTNLSEYVDLRCSQNLFAY